MNPSEWIEQSVISASTVSVAEEILRRSSKILNTENILIWLNGDSALHPQIATGDIAKKLCNQFSQPLNEGIISLVYACGNAICSSDTQNDDNHSKLADTTFNMSTNSMIAAPIVVNGLIQGVVSAASLTLENKEAFNTPTTIFSTNDLIEMEFLANVLGKLFTAEILQSNSR